MFPKYPVMNDLGYLMIGNRKGNWTSATDDNLYFDILLESSTDVISPQYDIGRWTFCNESKIFENNNTEPDTNYYQSKDRYFTVNSLNCKL